VESYATEDGKTKFDAYLKSAQVNWRKNGFSVALVNMGFPFIGAVCPGSCAEQTVMPNNATAVTK